MSFFQSRREVVIDQQVPSEVSRAALLAALHDHERMLKLSPLVFKSESIPAPEGKIHQSEIAGAPRKEDNTVWYRVWEKVPWVGDISFTASFANRDDGVYSTVMAPMGLRMKVSWAVIDDTSAPAVMRLHEVCELEGNTLLMPFITSTFEKTHRTMQEDLFKQLSGKASD